MTTAMNDSDFLSMKSTLYRIKGGPSTRKSLLRALAVLLLPMGAALAADTNENFDGVVAPALPAGWTSTVSVGAGSDAPWTSRAVGYFTSAPNALWIDDYNDYADIRLTSPTFLLAASGVVTVSFQQSYVFWSPGPSAQANGVYNGGVFEMSINGGTFMDVVDAGGSFAAGSYNATLDPSLDNPIETRSQLSRSVWGGSSNGYVFTAVTLPSSALSKFVRFRWRLGTESGGRSFDTHSGWWLDDFQCSQCQVSNDVIFENGFEQP